MWASQPSGRPMRMTSASAAPIQTGSARSSPRGTPSLGAKELHEALLDLLAPLLQLLRIGGEQLELTELGLVGGVLHLGVPRVEPLAVRHHLLHVLGEAEVGEEARRVR